MGGLKENLPRNTKKQKYEAKKNFTLDSQDAYRNLIHKKTNPKISQGQLDDIFEDVGLVAKK